jgi:hypothetical protein
MMMRYRRIGRAYQQGATQASLARSESVTPERMRQMIVACARKLSMHPELQVSGDVELIVWLRTAVADRAFKRDRAYFEKKQRDEPWWCYRCGRLFTFEDSQARNIEHEQWDTHFSRSLGRQYHTVCPAT